MKLLTKSSAIFDRILDLLARVGGGLLFGLMVIVCYEVVMRYFFNHPTEWNQEYSEIILLYVAFLGAAWLLRSESHVKVEILLTHLDAKTQALLGIFSSVIGIFISLVLVWYGAIVTIDHFLRGISYSTTLKTPLAAILIIIPIGGFPLLIQFLRRTYGQLQSWKDYEVKNRVSRPTSEHKGGQSHWNGG